MSETGNSAVGAVQRRSGITYSALTVRDILRFVQRRHRVILVCVVACLALAAAATLVMRPIYQSDAVVVVKFGREFVSRDVGEGANQTVPTSASTEELLNTLVQLLQSRDIAIATMTEIGIARLYPDLQLPNGQLDVNKAIDRFSRSLSARPLRSSNVVALSFQHPDPALAQTTLSTMIQVFRDSSLSIYATSQTQFFKQQEDLAQARLTQAADRLAAFRTQYGALAFESGLPLLLQQRGDLAALVVRSDADLAAVTDRVGNLRKQAQATPEEIVAHVDKEQSRVLDDARIKLLNLRLREQELTSQFADESPPLRQVRAEIRLAEQYVRQTAAEFAGTVRRARNQALIAIEQELSRAEAEQASYGARSASLRDALGKLDEQLATIARQDPERWTLERAVDTARTEVKQIALRVEQARLQDALNASRIGNIAIIQTPSLPDSRDPVRPRWSLNLALGAILGLLIGLSLAVLSEFGLAPSGRFAAPSRGFLRRSRPPPTTPP